MKLTVITPDATLLAAEVASINIAEKTGSYTILNDHAPLITVVKNFVATIGQTDTDLTYIAANAGTLKVLDNTVSLIIDYGIAGTSKDDARQKLQFLREEIAANIGNTGDKTVANMEIELMRRMKEMRS